MFCGSQRNNDVHAWPWQFCVSICREATKGKKRPQWWHKWKWELTHNYKQRNIAYGNSQCWHHSTRIKIKKHNGMRRQFINCLMGCSNAQEKTWVFKRNLSGICSEVRGEVEEGIWTQQVWHSKIDLWTGRKVCVEKSGQGSGGHQRGTCLLGVIHSNCRGTYYTLLFIFYSLLLYDKYAIKQLAVPSGGEQEEQH